MSTVSPLPPKFVDMHNHLFGDPDGSKLIAVMDEVGVETTLIMGVEGYKGIANNDEIIAAMRRFPGRFVAGAHLDPRQGSKAIDAMKHYHAEGAKVVKLFPNFGYYPDDEAFLPFWDCVAELKMGVLSHCGWLAAEPGEVCAAYYSHPGRFEKVIRVHRDTIFIMAHMGGIAGWLETVMLTTRTPNTYVDCSPGQGTLILEKGGPMAGAIPHEKLLFGADSYSAKGLIPRNAEAMEALGYGPGFEKIFYSTGRGILDKLCGVTPKA